MKALFGVLFMLFLSSCYYAVPYNEYYDDGYDDYYDNVYYGYSQSSYATETYYIPSDGAVYIDQRPHVTYINNYSPEVVYIDNPLLSRRPKHHSKPEPKSKVKPKPNPKSEVKPKPENKSSHHADNVKPKAKKDKDAGKKKNDEKSENIKHKIFENRMPKRLFR